MAKQLKKFPGKLGRTTWNYGQFLDGHVWEIKPGVDCSRNVSAARSTLCLTATRKGLKVRTVAVKDKKGNVTALIVQSYSTSSER